MMGALGADKLAALSGRYVGHGAGVDHTQVGQFRLAHGLMSRPGEVTGQHFDLALIQFAAQTGEVDAHGSTKNRGGTCALASPADLFESDESGQGLDLQVVKGHVTLGLLGARTQPDIPAFVIRVGEVPNLFGIGVSENFVPCTSRCRRS